MDCSLLHWRRHALERMFQRDISRVEVKKVLDIGEIIETYNDDQPFPSKLVFAIIDKKPLHVVVAEDSKTEECYIITAYVPTVEYFSDDFMMRRR